MNPQRLLADLARDEGLRLRPYRCPAGKLTIGYGRNIEDVGISKEEADFLLGNDIARVAKELDQALPWWRELDDARQGVLANLAFNLGTAGLMEFKKTLGHVRAGEYLEAAQEMLRSKWARQVGPRAVRLAAQMRDGELLKCHGEGA